MFLNVKDQNSVSEASTIGPWSRTYQANETIPENTNTPPCHHY